MADISELLGDVYGDVSPVCESDHPEPAPQPSPPVPEWADDAHLDEVFGRWNPGPSSDAPRAERDLFGNAEQPHAGAARDHRLAVATEDDQMPPLESAEGASGPNGRPPLDDDLAAALSAALASAPARPASQEGHEEPAPPAPSPRETPPMSMGSLFGQMTPHTAERISPRAEPPVGAVSGPVVEESAAVVPPPSAPTAARRWQRSDDDILPRSTRSRGRR